MANGLPGLPPPGFSKESSSGLPGLPPPGFSEVKTDLRPSWGQSASFVGRSAVEGVGKIADLASLFSPTYWANQAAEHLMNGSSFHAPNEGVNSIYSIFGRPEDSGVGGTAADIARSTMNAAVMPIGGVVGNALAGAGSEIAHKIAPDNWWAPLLGAVVPSAVGAGVEAMGNAALGAGKAFERASVGAGRGDFIRDMKIRGLLSDEEAGDLTTRLGRAINNIGDTEGWGLLRSPDKLATRNRAALEDIGGQIGDTLSKADKLGAVANPDFKSSESAVSKLLEGQSANRKEVRDAVSEFLARFEDPYDGWDGTVQGLNKWKSSVAEMGFSGSAKGTLPGPLARKIQRAIASDLGDAVNGAVTDSGATTAKDWGELLSKYGDHASVQPILDREAAGDLSNTYDKIMRSLIRTSGGTLTTPVIMGSALAGSTVGAPAGLMAGGLLAAIGSPTGRGITSNILKPVGRIASGVGDAMKSEIAPLFGLDKIEMPIAQAEGPDVSSNLFTNPNMDMPKPAPSPIPTPVIQAQIQAESSGDPNAVGPETKYGRAKGLMQLLDSTAKDTMAKMGLDPSKWDPFDKELNQAVGTHYLGEMFDKFGSIPLALAAYNWGPGNLMKLLSRHPDASYDELEKHLPHETKTYVAKIMANSQDEDMA